MGAMEETLKSVDFSFSLREKAGMREHRSMRYSPHPGPLPEGEGIV